MLRWFPWSIAALLAACSPKNEYVAPPPPAVTVAVPEQRDVTDSVVFPGTTIGQVVVEIRARVTGFLAKILYEPGQLVKKDQVLFHIDDAEHRAAVESAQADLESARADLASAAAAVVSAEAQLTLAVTAVAKLEKAYESRAVSEIQVLETKAKRDVAAADVDHAVAQVDVAQAGVNVAQASLDRAELDLSYTQVRSPISGYVTMWQAEVGALVGASDPTLLTTVIKDEIIHCYFDVSERALLSARRARTETGEEPQQKPRPNPGEERVARLALTGEDDFPHVGVIDYLEPTFDPTTGTARVRAVFQNPERRIPSGAFAMVQIPVAERKGALLVNERALSNDQAGAFLLVVNDKDVVERRDVKPGARHGDQIVILEGLTADDRVIVSGLQRARPGAVVAPETADA